MENVLRGGICHQYINEGIEIGKGILISDCVGVPPCSVEDCHVAAVGIRHVHTVRMILHVHTMIDHRDSFVAV